MYTLFRTAGNYLGPPRSTKSLLLSRVMANQTTQEDDDFEKLDMGSVAQQKGQLKVVVCGKVQTGKSSLINSLCGYQCQAPPPPVGGVGGARWGN